MKKNHIGILIVLISVMQIFSSCQSINRLLYFQKLPGQSDTLTIPKAYTSTIQTGDILSVTIGSLSPEASSFFNPYPSTAAPANVASTIAAINTSEATGFLVDEVGNIELPLLGAFKIQGLTTLQAKNLITEKLKPFLKEPTVKVRVMNYKITLMGELRNPSVYVIPNERITMLEAINLAGDLTEYGRRDRVMVVRDVDGKKEVGYVNLNDRSIFNSKYYYLRANDLVYVEPIASKGLNTNTAVRILPIAISVVSLLLVLYLQLKN